MKTIICLLLLSVINISAYGKELIFYTYHDKTPYYIQSLENQQPMIYGVYADLAAFLNSQQDEYQVIVKFLPRLRLQRNLELNILDGCIVGVNPQWFKDKEKTQYLWTEPFMVDQDVVIVRKGKTFNYQHPRDLIGKNMTLPRGYYFWGVTELIKEGRIIAEDTDSDIQNFKKITLGRSEATISSILTFRRLVKEHFAKDELEYLPTPHDSFERMILIPKNLENVYKTLNPLLNGILTNNEWLNELKKYDYQPN